MRVLHINCNYIGTALHQLMIERLDAAGVENEVFVPTFYSENAVIKPNENVCVAECFKKRDRYFFNYKQFKIGKSVEQRYNIGGFDIIHAYTLFTDGYTAWKLSKKYTKPFVVAVRNTDVNLFFKKMIHLRRTGVAILRDAAAVFFLSDAYRKLVIDRYVPDNYKKLIAKKCFVIPNGIDDFWHEHIYSEKSFDDVLKRISNKELRLAYAGKIDRNKNLMTTCASIDLLKEQGWNISYTVVGKIGDQAVFDDVKDYFTYYEPMPKERLIELYRRSDIFVMPSKTETFGLVYPEAMTQGLPVIYTKGQGFDGQFENGDVGFAVSADSARQVADAIIKISYDYESISKRCLSFSARFNWDDITAKYGEIYQKVAGKES